MTESTSTTGTEKDVIAPEQARAALVAMVSKAKDNAILQKELEPLKTSEIQLLDDGAILIGRWYCDLKQKEFVVSFAELSFLLEYFGIFQRSPSGELNAVIKGARQS